MRRKIRDLRKEYISGSLKISELKGDPIRQFEKWMEEAINKNADLPDAMHLATTGINGQPSGRIVLLRGFDERGFVFFTNYNSRKGVELNSNNLACLTFFWNKLFRQVRIEGRVYKLPEEESDAYFKSRPRDSRLAALASQQSRVLESRDSLEETFNALKEKFRNKSIPRPANWGGYYLSPVYFEFWQGRLHRLHDRVIYKKMKANTWSRILLYP